MKNSPLLNPAVHPFWWLGFPVFFLVFIVLVLAYDFELGKNMIGRENNLVELGTAIVLLPGIFFGIQTFRKRYLLKYRQLVIWVLLLTAACIYFFGEELSWGQQIFKWETPENITEINDQNETNLHNISSWLDQKPRILVELWILVGGIILPLWFLARGRRYTRENWKYWFWPDMVCLPTAVLTILVKMPERLRDFFNYNIFEQSIRYSELQEFYVALFLSLYIYSFYKRLVGPVS